MNASRPLCLAVLLGVAAAAPAPAQEPQARLQLSEAERALQQARLALRLRENLELSWTEEAAREPVAALLELGADAEGAGEAADALLLPHERLRLQAELAALDDALLARATQRTLLLLEAGLEVDPALRQLPGDPPEPWLAAAALDEAALLRRLRAPTRRAEVRALVREHALLHARLDHLETRVLPAHEANAAGALVGFLSGEVALEDVLTALHALTAWQQEAVRGRVRREHLVHLLASLLRCAPEEVVGAGRPQPPAAPGGTPMVRWRARP